MSGQGGQPSRRILAAFGEPDEFFGFTLADLKLLLPALFAGLIVAGNTPTAVRPLGWAVGGGLVLGALVVVYAAPEYQTAPAWLREKLRYAVAPSRFVPRAGERDPTGEQLRPAVEADSAPVDHRGIGRRNAGEAESLTELERFHVGVDAGERADGYVFGALRVAPANMALATRGDWERTAEQFGAVVNGIEFPFQVYSRVTPVDPERITAGYRDRLEAGAPDATPAFRELVATYARRLPREFAQRGTGVREYYVVVSVSPLAVQTGASRLGETGLLAQLGDLPYVGGFLRGFSARRSGSDTEEVRARQVAELDRRLNVVADGLRRIDGCRGTRLGTTELVELLDDFWSGPETATGSSPRPRTSPVVTAADRSDGGGSP
jgi:hypothetical protein